MPVLKFRELRMLMSLRWWRVSSSCYCAVCNLGYEKVTIWIKKMYRLHLFYGRLALLMAASVRALYVLCLFLFVNVIYCVSSAIFLHIFCNILYIVVFIVYFIVYVYLTCIHTGIRICIFADIHTNISWNPFAVPVFIIIFYSILYLLYFIFLSLTLILVNWLLVCVLSGLLHVIHVSTYQDKFLVCVTYLAK